MILVLGNSPKRVHLKDLQDYVYYKQKKVFSESEYDRSPDLQREIKKGSLTVLKRTLERDGNFELPDTGMIDDAVPAVQTPQVPPDPRIESLLQKITDLEQTLQQKPSRAPGADVVGILTERIEKLEQYLQRISKQPVSAPQEVSGITEAIVRLEQKIEKQTNPDDLIQRLEALIARTGTVVSSQKREATRIEDIYVPEVHVEDANTHIKLKTRTVERSDDVTDALSALKKLRNKQ